MNSKSDNASASKSKILQVISQTERSTSDARERKKNKKNASAFLTIWNDRVVEDHGKQYVASAIGRRVASLKRAILKKDLTPDQRQDFIEWSVYKWHQIGQQRFSRYTDYPGHPVVEFFIKMIDTFYLAYCVKDQPVVRSANKSRTEEQDQKLIAKLQAENKELKLTIARQEEELVVLRKRIKRVGKKDTGTLPSWD